MQRANPILSNILLTLTIGKREREYHKGSSKRKKKNPPSPQPGNDYLNTVFTPYPITQIYSLFTRKNYNNLYQSAKNYSNLLGSSFDLEPDGDYQKLCTYFKTFLTDPEKLQIKNNKKKLSFEIYIDDDYLCEPTFYFIPLSFLECTFGKLREIILSFLQIFQSIQKLDEFDETPEYIFTVMENCEQEDGYSPERTIFLDEYKQGGRINLLMNLVYHKSRYSINQLLDQIDDYKTQSENEVNLLDTIKQGLKILQIGEEVFNYAEPPDLLHVTDDPDYYVRYYYAKQLVRYVYCVDDFISNEIYDYMKSDISEYGWETIPATTLVLTPSTNQVFEPKFPDIFFPWFDRFICQLRTFENNKYDDV